MKPSDIPSDLTNNLDAAFATSCSPKDLPSPLLLHYVYGATVLKLWGKNKEIISMRDNIPRPSPLPNPRMGHDRKRSDHNRSRRRSSRAKEKDEDDQSLRRDGDNKSGSEDLYESGFNRFQGDFLRTPQGAEDLVAWYWLHSPEAIQKMRDEEREAKSAIETWRSNVAPNQDP